MGVLNITPDSFSDGGRYIDFSNALNHALKMIDMGADIIDVGGESTRPGSDPVSKEDECQRIIPVIEAIKKINSEILISVDTYKSFVAKRAIDAGADIVNDISGLTFDHKMLSVLLENNVPVIIMHINGHPKTMQNNPSYNDLIKDISDFLLKQAKFAEINGIKKSNIILDPGIGFGKSFEHNFSLIRRLNEISDLGYPLMIGPSRKAFIGNALELPPEDRIEGTLATVIVSIMNGANIIRVHDVKETKRAVIITERILGSV